MNAPSGKEGAAVESWESVLAHHQTLMRDRIRARARRAAGDGLAREAMAAPRDRISPDRVWTYLEKNYPPRVLGWVKRCTWHAEHVPLREVVMGRRPGGRNNDKVEGIATAIKKGKPMEPVVLVRRPDGRWSVADGYHRTLAFQRAGYATISAWVTEDAPPHGPWEARMHAAKLNKAPGKTASVRGWELWKDAREEGRRE